MIGRQPAYSPRYSLCRGVLLQKIEKIVKGAKALCNRDEMESPALSVRTSARTAQFFFIRP